MVTVVDLPWPRVRCGAKRTPKGTVSCDLPRSTCPSPSCGKPHHLHRGHNVSGFEIWWNDRQHVNAMPAYLLGGA